jgi:plastocyanin
MDTVIINYFMKQAIYIGIITVSAVLLGAGCSSQPATTPPTPPPASVQPAPQATAPEPATKPAVKPATAPATPPRATTGKNLTITIGKSTIAPAMLTVKVGTTVTWKNTDSVVHTVSAERGQFNSGSIQPGKTFSYTFKEIGLVPFY